MAVEVAGPDIDGIPQMDKTSLRTHAYKTLLGLATPEGFNASGREDIYGCFFGRDSAITILKIQRAHTKSPSLDLLDISRRSLKTLVELQGRELNIESGEEPGKFIHEFRKDRYEHLVRGERPWFIYPDGYLRNYDSVDGTPLTLIAMFNHWQITQDRQFLVEVLDSVEKGLNWIISYGDKNGDGLIDYEFHPERKHGGLLVQSWTDSHESVRREDGIMPCYPISPVEVQGFVWLALKLWGNFYLETSGDFGRKILSVADWIKREFNERYIIYDNGLAYAAQAIDGDGRQITTITSNPLMLLWATFEKDSKKECILDEGYINDFVKRVFMDDLFDGEIGIRTMSTTSPTFNPRVDSYHNGSVWPFQNCLIHEGLETWGYLDEAEKLEKAIIRPFAYFGSTIELCSRGEDGSYLEYQAPNGQVGCRDQAWSAAGYLDLLTKSV